MAVGTFKLFPQSVGQCLFRPAFLAKHMTSRILSFLLLSFYYGKMGEIFIYHLFALALIIKRLLREAPLQFRSNTFKAGYRSFLAPRLFRRTSLDGGGFLEDVIIELLKASRLSARSTKLLPFEASSALKR